MNIGIRFHITVGNAEHDDESTEFIDDIHHSQPVRYHGKQSQHTCCTTKATNHQALGTAPVPVPGALHAGFRFLFMSSAEDRG